MQKLQHGRTIKPGTWDHSYEPVLADAVKMLSGRLPPSNPADLLDLSIRTWEPGSRMRQIRAQSLAQFLRYCVNREHFPALWLPPSDLRSHVGAKGAQAGSGLKGDPLTDQQIIHLLASLPVDAAGGRRWRCRRSWSASMQSCSAAVSSPCVRASASTWER